MDFPTVQAQLNDLPGTFTRDGPPYTQLIDSLTAGEAEFTEGSDGVISQVVDFQNAWEGWLDLWGLLFLIPRNQNESDIPYKIRIQETTLAWVGTPAAAQRWLDLFAPGGSVKENFPAVGYSLTLPATMSVPMMVQFLQSFARIRPLGVPFTINVASGGLFLGTEAFLGLGRVQGSYLINPSNSQLLQIAALTNNARPLIPSLYLTDPIINGVVG